MESMPFTKVTPGCKVYLQDGEKIPEGLICPHCKLILNDPVQTVKSGLRFCRLCFDSKPAGVFPNEEKWSDVAVKNEIAQLPVVCKNRITGCEWMGLFKDYIKHISDCQRTHEPRDNHVQPTSFADSKTDIDDGPKEELRICDEVQQACGPDEDVTLATSHSNQARPHPPLGMDGFQSYTTEKFGELDKKIDEKTVKADERIASVEKQNNEMKDELKELKRTVRNIQTDYSRFYSGSIVWRIDGVSKHLNKAIPSKLTSPPFYTKREGYKMCLIAHLHGDGASKGSYLSIYFAIMRGEYDPLLKWPFMAKVTITLLSQDHSKNSANKDIVRSFIPDSNSLSVRMPTSSIMNPSTGFQRFTPCSFLNNHKAMYVKDDVMFIKAGVDTAMIAGH